MSYQFRNQRSVYDQHVRPGRENYYTQSQMMLPYSASQAIGGLGTGNYYYSYPQYVVTSESFMIAIQAERLENQKIRAKLAEKEEESNSLKLQITNVTKENAEKDEEINSLRQQISNVTKENAEKDEEINSLRQQIAIVTKENAEKDEEINSLRLQITKLEAEPHKLKCDLEDRDEKVKALSVLNELLMSGNEKRDETIAQYKKKLKNYISSSLSSVASDLRLGELSYASVSDNDAYSPSTLTRTSLSPVSVEHQKLDSKAYLSFSEYEYSVSPDSPEKRQEESNIPLSFTETFMSPVAAEQQQLDLLPASDNESNIPLSSSDSMSPVPAEHLKLANNLSLPVNDDESNISSSLTEKSLSPVAEDHQQLDSKKLNALIALGAENTMGPWFCLLCGKDGHPMSIPSYPEYRRHLIDVHQKLIDPALCEKCGWRSHNYRELDFHMFETHQIQSYFYSFSKSAISKLLKNY
ncbi:hypothetical protein ACLKA6_014950 [Drosophila palustris]